MTPALPPDLHAGDTTSRYWALIHDGQIHSISWDDGEQLLGLANAVRDGRLPAKDFSFCPRGSQPGEDRVTVRVEADTPIELVSQYDREGVPTASHWFG